MTTPKRLWALLLAPAIAISVGLPVGLWLSSGSTGGRSASYKDGYAHAVHAQEGWHLSFAISDGPCDAACKTGMEAEQQLSLSKAICGSVPRQPVPSRDDRHEWVAGCLAALPWKSHSLTVLVPNEVGQPVAAHQPLLNGVDLRYRVVVLPPTPHGPSDGYVAWQRPKAGSAAKAGSVVLLGVGSGQ